MKKKKVAQPQIWSDADTVQLLAWLDFTLRHPEINFGESIAGHLCNRYTLTKIESRLVRLWQRHGPVEAPSQTKAYALHQVYSKGSGSLNDTNNGLRDTVAKEIADTVDKLEILEKVVPSANRNRRNTSRLGSSAPNSSTRSNTIEATESHQQTSKRKLKNRNPRQSLPFTPPRNDKKRKRQHHTRLYDPPESSKEVQDRTTSTNPQTSRGKDSRESYVRFPPTIDDSDESPSSSALRERAGQWRRKVNSSKLRAVQDNEGQLGGRVTDDDVEEATRCICNEPDNLSEEKNWIQCADCKTWQCVDCAEYICEGCIGVAIPKQDRKDVDIQVKLGCPDCDASNEQVRGAALQIDALKSTLDGKSSEMIEKLEDIKNMERRISVLKCAQQKRDAHLHAPMEAEIGRLLEEKDRLQRELGDRDALGVFTRLSTKSQSRHKTQEIVSKLHEVYSFRSESLAKMRSRSMSCTLQLEQNEDLRDLICGAIGVGRTLTDDAIDQTKMLLQTQPENFVESLLMSAIQQWVFYSNFPYFDGESSDTLRVYRENIAFLDGPAALRNLDLATVTHLISEPKFRGRVVPEEASRLTNRLARALEPLFQEGSEAPRLTWDGFATWQSQAEDFQARRESLKNMFANALLAKAESCKNIEWYEMVIYRPGTPFNRKTMTAQTLSGTNLPSGQHATGNVHVCVEAALFAWTREDPEIGDNIMDCLMSGRNFKTQQQHAFAPLMKAVVVLA